MNTPKLVRVVRCNSCGLIYPENVFQEWGKKYGRGIGKVPKCEGLQSRYQRGPTMTKPDGSRVPADKIMHPLHVCRGSLNVVDVPEAEAAENVCIAYSDDKGMEKRAAILRSKQAERSAVIKKLRMA